MLAAAHTARVRPLTLPFRKGRAVGRDQPPRRRPPTLADDAEPLVPAQPLEHLQTDAFLLVLYQDLQAVLLIVGQRPE